MNHAIIEELDYANLGRGGLAKWPQKKMACTGCGAKDFKLFEGGTCEMCFWRGKFDSLNRAEHELLRLLPHAQYRTLSSMINLVAETSGIAITDRRAIIRLQRLGFVSQNSGGNYCKSDAWMSVSREVKAWRK